MHKLDTLHLDNEPEVLDEADLSDNPDWETVSSEADYDEWDSDEDYDEDDGHLSLDDIYFTYASDDPDTSASSDKTVTHTFTSEASPVEEIRIDAWLVDSSPAPTPRQIELDFGDMPFEVYEEPVRYLPPLSNATIDRHTITTNLKRLLQRRHLRRISDMEFLHELSEGAAGGQESILL